MKTPPAPSSIPMRLFVTPAYERDTPLISATLRAISDDTPFLHTIYRENTSEFQRYATPLCCYAMAFAIFHSYAFFTPFTVFRYEEGR
jgi:hypothetical protein